MYLQKPYEILMVSLFLIFLQAIWMEIKQDPKVHVQEKKNLVLWFLKDKRESP